MENIWKVFIDAFIISGKEKIIMQIIKLGLISLVAFALLITMFSLFIPSHIRISKAIDITAQKDSISNQISNTSNWKNWYPGADSLPIEKGKEKEAGAFIKVNTVTDSTVIANVPGMGPKETTSGWNFYSGTTPNTITVQWYMDFHLRWYPWEKFSGLLLENRYGPMMEQGLTNLKRYLEK